MNLYRLGGHQDNSDVMLGNITDFNVWDKSLTEKETERQIMDIFRNLFSKNMIMIFKSIFTDSLLAKI